MLQIDVAICEGYFGNVASNIPRLGDDATIFHVSNKNVSKRAQDMVTELMDGLEVETHVRTTISFPFDVNVRCCVQIEKEKKPSIVAFPVARIEKIGQGSSSTVFKSVLLRTLTLCAEKVNPTSFSLPDSSLCCVSASFFANSIPKSPIPKFPIPILLSPFSYPISHIP